MATKEYYFSGTSKWAKVYKPDDKYNNWTINVYLDPESEATFKESRLSLKFKEDADGKFITFRRPQSKLIKNQTVDFEAPKVVDKDNNPFSETIGNGSKVTVKVSVYDLVMRPGVGHRLEAVRVDELVEYKPTGDVAEKTPQSNLASVRPF